MQNGWIRFVGLALGAVAIAGCSSSMDAGGAMVGAPGGGDFGATQGGVQDMSFARELVEQGKVPPAGAFLPEAMFSEHDLPLAGAPCATTLCLRGALGVAPDAEGRSSAWVQIGMSSTIDPATYERPTLALIATVDVSGSMGWGYPNGETPGEVSRVLLQGLASRLGPSDRFAMVTYGSSVQVPVPLVAGDDPAIAKAIAALGEGGSTNMEAGLQKAFALAASALGQADEVRVVLFTDVQPNVGATSASAFSGMTSAAADQGIRLTVLGLGLGLGEELMTAMAGLRGGNAFSLMAQKDVPLFFEDNWPWFVSPIAYRLAVVARPTAPLVVTRGYGFPVQEGAEEASLEVATIFLSKRKGALLLQLTGPGSEPPVDASAFLTLTYETKTGEPHQESLSVAAGDQALDEQGISMPEPGLDKTVALALLVSGMRSAAEQYGTSREAAIARLESTLDRFQSDAARIADPAIDEEALFWTKLLDLMQSNAPQGNFYGQ